MAAVAGRRAVEFDVPPQGAYAVQLRLTPALLESLLRAQEAGQGASIRFGTGPQANAISVGGSDFRFNSLPEETCDLLCMPGGGGSGGSRPSIVGAVRQKLMVQRNIQDERERVRARAEEAERKGQERKAQMLDGKPAKAKAMASITTVQRSTPPPPSLPPQPPRPQQQYAAAAGQQQLQPQPLKQSMLAGASGKPPAHPSTAAALAGRAATPPPPLGQPGTAAAATAAAAAKAAHKPAPTGKLGLTAKQGSTASLGAAASQLYASSLVMSAARAGSLRLAVIAMLSERAMGMKGIKDVLADAVARVKGFKKPSKDEVVRTIKAVSEFQSPGKYVVYPMLLAELSELAPAGSSEAPAGSDSPAPQPSGRSSEGAEAAAAGAGPSARSKKKKSAAAAPAAAAAAGGSSGGGGGLPHKVAAGSKRSRHAMHDWSEDDSSDAEQQPPAAQRARQHQQHHHPVVAPPAAAAAAAPAFAASPPSVGGGPGGSSSSGGGGTGPAGGPLQRRTSSSRGSDHADESWIKEHADRQPEPAAPINTKEEYHAREAAFNQKYKQYFELHQLIEAHKKDFEAMHAATTVAATEAEREKYRSELERLHRRRGDRAKRWDSAYRVLHQELSAAKARMSEFVQQLQRLQPAAPGAAAGGGALEALPAVRVK